MGDNIIRNRHDCPFCPAVFLKGHNLRRHMNTMHENRKPVYTCILCGFQYNGIEELRSHVSRHEPKTDFTKVVGLQGACSVHTRIYVPPLPSLELTLFADHDNIFRIVQHELVMRRRLKISIVITAEFIKMDGEGNTLTSSTNYLRSKSFECVQYTDVAECLRRSFAEISVNCEDFVTGGSNWILFGVYKTEIQMVTAKALAGGCGNRLSLKYSKDIDKVISESAEQSDMRCLFRAVGRYFVGVDDAAAIEEFIEMLLQTKNISVPVAVRGIARFEKENKHLDFKVC